MDGPTHAGPPRTPSWQDARTLGALRRALARELAEAALEGPEGEARALVAAALGCPTAALLSRSEEAVPADLVPRLAGLLARRRAGEPMARIVGRKEFWSLEFQLSPETLVPRPDTETVVEAALAAFAGRPAPARLLDLGTGTGAILAALLVEWPAAFGIGIELSADAARTARDNLARVGLGGRACVVRADWGAALAGGFDLVVSNPPYIATADLDHLAPEVKVHDPRRALDGGPDGLAAYRAIAADLRRLLVCGGIAVLELGAGQEADVAALLAGAGLEVCGPARRDLGGIARAMVARRGPAAGPGKS